MIDTFRQFHIALIVIIAIQSHRVFSAAVQDSSSSPTWSSTSNPLPTTQVDSQNSRMLYWSHQSWRSRPDSSPPVKLCGYRLLDAVRVLCRGSFNSFSRRSDTTAPLAPRLTTNNNNNAIPLSGTQNLNSVTVNDNSNSQNANNDAHTSPRRVRRHIIEECCRRACNRRQMLKYCDWNV